MWPQLDRHCGAPQCRSFRRDNRPFCRTARTLPGNLGNRPTPVLAWPEPSADGRKVNSHGAERTRKHQARAHNCHGSGAGRRPGRTARGRKCR
ncbi:cobalamin biosynthesis CbiG protein [Actinomyces sp. oral taxon 178 str. F0338]|nr:cobalamin biosynthesis CbiG protein [Actinomyces sp. oral taxon 178 str. F0338]